MASTDPLATTAHDEIPDGLVTTVQLPAAAAANGSLTPALPAADVFDPRDRHWKPGSHR